MTRSMLLQVVYKICDTFSEVVAVRFWTYSVSVCVCVCVKHLDTVFKFQRTAIDALYDPYLV